jgi:hypothetical protein
MGIFSRQRVDDNEGRGGRPWHGPKRLMRKIIDLWASTRLDEFRALGETAPFNRFKFATDDDGTFHDVLQPSLHAYPGAAVVSDLQRKVRDILGTELSRQVEWLAPNLVHLNMARYIPNSREEERAINERESRPERRQQVQNIFANKKPVKMTVNGVTANDTQLMVTFSVKSWHHWQELAYEARKIGLTSFPLEKDPVSGGFLVSMTLGTWKRDSEGKGFPTGPIADKLKPYLPGTHKFPQVEFSIDELAYVLHHHQAAFPVMSPGFHLATPELGRARDLGSMEAERVPLTANELTELASPDKGADRGIEKD